MRTISSGGATFSGFNLPALLLTLLIPLYHAHAETLLQDRSAITGTVKDGETGESIAGATVAIKGTNLGTTTNENGEFTLQAAIDDELVTSFIGYITNTTVVTDEDSYSIELTPSAEQLSEIVIVGSRSQNRTVIESPVPIDIIEASNIANAFGKVEINQILQYAAPSFNATKQSGSDGADHIDPASLRGLGPDQTLVLINGKRRHQSSLVNVFGTRGRGNSGTDLNAIPASAIKRIEILRDGASAQYGSDAIAGVVNIVLKDNTDGVTGGITYGAYSTAVGSGYAVETGETIWNVEGKDRLDGKNKKFDGNTFRMDMNYGMKLGDNGGFANLTTEYASKERTLRPGFPWRKGYGTAAVDGFNFMVNATLPISERTEFYAFGGSNFRQTDAYAYTRDSYSNGDNRSVPTLYPDGFTPHITSDIRDVSASAGLRHGMENGWKVDFSNTFGKNNFHYYITGTNNASLGAASPIDFDAGGHSLSMNVTNLDFSRYFENIAAGFNFAFGSEFRTERFTIFAGEEGSYALYDQNRVAITNPATQTPAVDSNGEQLPGGAQGFPGYSPDNEVDRSRTNYGLYADAELNATKAFLVNGAIRFEKYSDFGNTFNAKAAARYAFGEALSLRGSYSTGFRAPSLAQIHYNLIFNNFVAGESLPSLLSANTSTVTRAFGIGPLKEETAQNTSFGFTFRIGNFTATVDAYSINVQDRIVLTDNFDASGLGLGVEAAQFFANGVDTKTTGLDAILGYNQTFGTDQKIGITVSGNFNNLDIEDINSGGLNPYTFFGPFSQAYLKAAAPDYKIGTNLTYSNAKLLVNVFLTQFSEVIIQDFQWVDTPATSEGEADALYAVATDTYDAMMTVDLNVTYHLTPSLSLTVGSNNLFNKYPTPQFDGWTDQGGLNDSVQMGSDGAYYFGRLGFRF
ncbi:MAG: TonB-dependent receptor [Chryseosolibacter sp.]